jgi:FlaA1/EpsC-like NDP-sugar epimerase
MRRQVLAYVHDLIMTAIGFAVALYLRVGDDSFDGYVDVLLTGLPISLLIAAVVYRLCGLYRGIWRYSSTEDLTNVVRAVSTTIALFLLAMFLINRLDPLPRSVPLINWFVLIVLLGGPRFLYRMVKDRRLADKKRTSAVGRIPVLLVGSDRNAELFIRSLSGDGGALYRVVGMLDRKAANVGRAIHGVSVLGTLDDLERVVEARSAAGDRPQRVVITTPSHELKGEVLRALLERCDTLNLPLARLPSLTDFQSTDAVAAVALKPIAIEDLLGRAQVALDRTPVCDMIRGARVLVTGAGGSIGSELCRQIAADAPARLVILEQSEYNLYRIEMQLRTEFPAIELVPLLGDVRRADRMLSLMQRERPDLVFHAAARKHVPIVEANVPDGVATNCLGTRNVADAARQAGVRCMVLISTDKAVRPVSVMGATKRLAEAWCQSLDYHGARRFGSSTRFITVRFGNVLGSSGSVVPLFQEQLAAGGPLTVTHPEMTRYFMTIAEAVQLVLQASAHGLSHPEDAGRLFVLDMGKPVKIVDLARQMIRLAGLRPDVDVKIDFVGLRPGEKLYEELFDEAERTLPTPVDGVMVASPQVIDPVLLMRTFDEIERAVDDEASDRLRALLAAAVPGYLPPSGTDATPDVRERLGSREGRGGG